MSSRSTRPPDLKCPGASPRRRTTRNSTPTRLGSRAGSCCTAGLPQACRRRHGRARGIGTYAVALTAPALFTALLRRDEVAGDFCFDPIASEKLAST
jgi:hypothetical protein